jgi:hypothetical protein
VICFSHAEHYNSSFFGGKSIFSTHQFGPVFRGGCHGDLAVIRRSTTGVDHATVFVEIFVFYDIMTDCTRVGLVKTFLALWLAIYIVILFSINYFLTLLTLQTSLRRVRNFLEDSGEIIPKKARRREEDGKL